MNYTTTHCATNTPNNNQKNNNHYFIPAKTKICNAVKFYNWIRIDYFKEDIFQTFNVSNHERWRFLNNHNFFCRL